MVTNEYYHPQLVIASHLWPNKQHGVGLDKFNLTINDTYNARNGILMLKDIEKAFDTKRLCFIYDPFQKKFIVRVLDPDIINTVISNTDPSITFGNINDKILQHPSGKFPFPRILSHHAKCTFSHAQEKNWITAEQCISFKHYFELSEGATVPDFDFE